jgi:hypothetical protein
MKKPGAFVVKNACSWCPLMSKSFKRIMQDILRNRTALRYGVFTPYGM